MSYHIVRPATHEEWLEQRKTKVGASSAGTIMGVSPFMTKYQLWAQMKGLIPPPEESDAMFNGHSWELAVADWFERRGYGVIDRDSEGDWFAIDDEHPWRGVSPDRLFWEPGAEQTSDNWLLMEIKSTAKIVDKDNPPLYWFCQIQYQMGVMGIKRGVLAWVSSEPRLGFDYLWVDFNPVFFSNMIREIDRFWLENIQKDIEPEQVTGRDFAIKFPTSVEGKKVEASEADLSNCREYLRLKEQYKETEERIAELACEIQASIRDAEVMVVTDGEGRETIVAKHKSINEKVFDEKKFISEHGDIYRKYVHETFDRTEFKKENAKLMGEYCTTVPGARRFTVPPGSLK